MSTKAGPLFALPVSSELDDRLILTVKNHSEEEWRDQILEAAAQMTAEHERYGAQCLGLTLTPYIVGLPFRVQVLRETVSALTRDRRVLTAGVSAIVDSFK